MPGTSVGASKESGLEAGVVVHTAVSALGSARAWAEAHVPQEAYVPQVSLILKIHIRVEGQN